MSHWTILIYANGNNELEPEMYESMLDCEKVSSNCDVNVIIQLARADRKIAEIMRPDETFSKENNSWTGVRRYYIGKSNSQLIQDLGKINMAHPNTLYEFIKWGIETYPSEHYMVVLAGHGISFVGNLLDLTFDTPYIMGIPEMCQAIDLVGSYMDIKIDILVLDMCNMNSIEILYEFGKNKINAVSNILTYIGEGPFKGLPYNILIELVQNCSNFHNIKKLIKEIINTLNLDTIAFEINNEKLESIKDKFSNLAFCYLSNNYKYNLHYTSIFTKNYPIYPWYNVINELSQCLISIIIHQKICSNNKKSLIKVTCEGLGNLITIYGKLAFTKNNHWMNLLSGKKIDDELINNTEIYFKPMKLSKDINLYSILAMNPNLTIEQARSIINKIFSN